MKKQKINVTPEDNSIELHKRLIKTTQKSIKESRKRLKLYKIWLQEEIQKQEEIK